MHSFPYFSKNSKTQCVSVQPTLGYISRKGYKDSEWSVTRLSLDKKLPVHSGCVNTVCWNSDGQYLLSGSDDRKLAITSPFTQNVKPQSIVTRHRANIFSAKFLPHSDDLKIISAAGDGCIKLVDLGLASSGPDADSIRSFACHRATVFDIVTCPSEANVFLSVSADGTLRQFDLRVPESGHTVLLSNQHCKYYGYTAAVVHPLANARLFAADKDGFIGEYDRRWIGYGRWLSQSKPVEVLSSKRLVRVTSLSFDPRASRLLASYNGGTLYLFDINRLVPNSELPPAPNATEDPLHGGGNGDAGGASPAEESGRIIFRFRGDWSDTGPESEPPSERPGGAFDYSERLGQFMMRAYQLNRQRNPEPSPDQPPDGPGEPDELAGERPDPDRNAADDPELVRIHRAPEPPPAGADVEQPHSVSAAPASESSAAVAVSGGTAAANDVDPRAWSQRSDRPALADSGSQAEAAGDHPCYPVCRVFQGHRNARTCIQQAAFWGSEFVISGSDCGHFLVWRASDGCLLNAYLADQRVVNRVAPHPSLLYLATSGIDYDVKLWSPIASGERATTPAELAGLVRRNQAMLAQTMNTVTVPGSAMLSIMRMLSRLYSRDAQ